MPATDIPAATNDTEDELFRFAARRLGSAIGGRWTLRRVLGVGGTGCVYFGENADGESAALKVLHPELARDSRAKKRFLREATAASRLNHPGVVRILEEPREDEGDVYLVMELLAGKSLDSILAAKGAMDIEDVVHVAGEVLAILAEAHDAGIIHRDIKPSNIFERSNRDIKLLDFGSARVHDASTSFVTRSGAALGTPAFMAPEQAAGLTDAIDPRTDLWALGATMFQLLTGRSVHDAGSLNEALISAATRPAPPLRAIRPDVPRALAEVIDRALAFEKRDRWPNARGMRAALARDPEAIALDARDSGASTLPESRPPVKRRTRALEIGALAAIGIALAFTQAARSGAPAIAPPTAAVPASIAAPTSVLTPAPPPLAESRAPLADFAAPLAESHDAGATRGSADPARAVPPAPSSRPPRPRSPAPAPHRRTEIEQTEETEDLFDRRK